jgi:hypothetical protein
MKQQGNSSSKARSDNKNTMLPIASVVGEESRDETYKWDEMNRSLGNSAKYSKIVTLAMTRLKAWGAWCRPMRISASYYTSTQYLT